MRSVGCQGYTTLVSYSSENAYKGLIRQVWRRSDLVYTKLSQEATKLVFVGVRRINAKHMNTLRGRDLETREYGDIGADGRLSKVAYITGVVVISNGQNRDIMLVGLLNYRLGMRSGVTSRCLAPKSLAVLIGVDLQSAAMENRASATALKAHTSLP